MDHPFLHACTPARLHVCVLLGKRGNSVKTPITTYPSCNASLTHSTSSALALTLVSSLSRGGISAHCSKIFLRQTPTPDHSRSLAGSYTTITNHNQEVSLLTLPALSRCSRPASQARLEAINESGRNQTGLTDGLNRSKNLQKSLSAAKNGMSAFLLLLYLAAIHNYRLSIPKSDDVTVPIKNPERKQKKARAFFLFSFHTNTGPCLETLVKGKQSGLDKSLRIWHLVAVALDFPPVGGHSTRQTRNGEPTSRTRRRAVSKPHAFKYRRECLEVLYG